MSRHVPKEDVGGKAAAIAGTVTYRVPLNSEGKPICGAQTRSGKPCQQAAGYGTDHVGFGTCKHHAGSMPSGKVGAARQEAIAYVDELKALGKIGPEVSPDDALMQEVARSQYAVEYMDDVVKEMTEGENPEDPASPRFTKIMWQWNEQRRLLANVSRLVVQAGIARRSVEIQEMQATAVLAAVLATIESPELSLDPEKVDLAKRMVAGKLRELTSPEQRLELAGAIDV